MEEGNGIFDGLEAFNSFTEEGFINPEGKSEKEDKVEVITGEELANAGKPAEEETGEQEELTEEEIETKNKSTKETEEQEETEEDPDVEVFKTFGSILSAKGLIAEESLENITSEESLIEAFEEQINKGIDGYINDLPEELKSIIENYEEGVPLDTLVKLKSEKIKYSSIAEDKVKEDKDLQKTLIEDYLKSTGLKEAKIKKIIEGYEDSDELLEESIDALKELKDISSKKEKDEAEKTRKQNLANKQAYEKQIKELDESIKNKKEIIPGVKLTDKARKELFDSITKPVRDSKGNYTNKITEIRSKNPMEFDMIVHHMANLGVFEGKWDSVINGAGKTKSKELADKIKAEDKTKTGKDNINTIPKSTDLYAAIKKKYKP